MRFYKDIEVDVNTHDLLTTAFREEPGTVVNWFRENAEEIIKWLKWNEKYMEELNER